MRGIARAACWALLSAASIFSQTSTKPAAGAVGLGKTESVANADKNIRAYIELLRSDVKTSKSQIMGEVMQLNTDQATKFWPIYKGFETEYARLGDQIVAVVMKYTDEFEKMNDDLADQLAQQVLSIEQQRNALKKTYYDRVKQGLGGIVAMRFLQVENQLERLVDLQIAASLPVIDAR
jgi:uncharacterized protein Yka (UPF0111/DUF47 family)